MKKLLINTIKILTVILILLSVLLPVTVGTVPVFAADEAGFTIVFNPSGTHIKDGQLKIRLDFYPDENTKIYDTCYIYAPIIPEGGYSGKIDKDGNPIDQDDYALWLISLPHEWRLNPALVLFVVVEPSITKEELNEFISDTFTASVLSTIDNSLIQNNAIHLISPFMRDKNSMTDKRVAELSDYLRGSINTELADVQIYKGSSAEPILIKPQSIDVGSNATRNADFGHNGYRATGIDGNNPVNLNGTIDTFYIFSQAGMSDVDMGTFIDEGSNTFSSRDYEEGLGAVAGGSYQMFTGLDCQAEAGDYLGARTGAATEYYGRNSITGDGAWYKLNIGWPVSSVAFTPYGVNNSLCLYATGEEYPPTPLVDTGTSSNKTSTSIDMWGNITYHGASNVTQCGFIINGSSNVTDNYSSDNYTLTIPGLSPGTKYNIAAFATSANGTGYGDNVTVMTLPESSTSFSVNSTSYQSVNLTWTLGSGQDYAEVRYSYLRHPVDNTSGALGYFGTSTSCNITPVSSNSTIYFRIFSHAYDTGDWTTDAGNITANTTTPIRSFPNFIPPDTYNAVFIGDSIFATNDGTRVGDEFAALTGYSVLNKGVPAQHTPAIAARFDTDVIANSPNIVVIEGGTNDIGGGDNITSFLNAWTSMLNTAEADSNIQLVIVSLIMPRTSFTDVKSQTMETWNDALETLAANYTKTMVIDTQTWVGTYRATGDPGNMWDIVPEYDLDTTHYNALGEFWLAQAFTTGVPFLPQVTTGSESSVTCNSFYIWGNITDDGGGAITTVAFDYGIGGFTGNVSAGYTTDNYSLQITGLTANTEYMVRARVSGGGGTAYGETVNVTTSSASNPTFTTVAASSITSSSAQLNGTIAGLDCLAADDTLWQWSLSSGNYTANFTDTANHSNGSVYYNLTPLSAETKYYFRGGSRINGGSYQYGAELSFTTASVPSQAGGSSSTTSTETTTSGFAHLDDFVMLVPLILFSVLAFWKNEPILFLITAGISMFTGLNFHNSFSTDSSLAIGLGLILYCFACFGFSFLTLFRRERSNQ